MQVLYFSAFFHITFGKSSDIESDNKKCLLNLWSTWHKYISLTETTSIYSLLSDIFDSVVFDKCSFTVN